MRSTWAVGVALLTVLGAGAPGDLYQWTYDQLALGPGWVGHVFVNRTGMEAQGLEVLLAQAGRAQTLVIGGALVQDDLPLGFVLLGRVVPGGLVIVALPEGIPLHQAAWITPVGRIPIDLDLPIPRLTVAQLFPRTVFIYVEADVPHILPYPEPVFLTLVEQMWFEDLDPNALRMWEGHRYLVRLDAQRSFSPVGEEIVAWKWFWEDGLVQEGPVVIRGFVAPGIHRVRLVVTDAAGRKQVLTRLVEARVWENFSDEPGLSIKPLPSQEQERPKDLIDEVKPAR